MNNKGTYDFIVRGYECGPDEMATLPNVMNYLQEAAEWQAEEFRYSRRDFEKSGLNISWVLTRFYIQLTRYPRWEERVQITTWPCKGRFISVNRDFLISINGEIIGRATSEWVLIDLATRKIASIPQSMLDAMEGECDRSLPNYVFSHLKWGCQSTSSAVKNFIARRTAIDINGHVNNTRYVEWIIEALPDGNEHPKSFEITYKAETLVGESVIAEKMEDATGTIQLRLASLEGNTKVLALATY